MRKFAKLLTLVISLVMIITAFTVVSLATDEEAPAYTVKVAVDKNYNTYADGLNVQNASNKFGKAVAVKQDDGNVYLLFSYEDAVGGDQAENYDNDAGKTNYIAKYPIVSVSFDVMSPQGVHSSSTYFAARLYNNGTSVGYFTNTYIYMSGIGLSNVPYDWQHVSIVIEQDPTTLAFYLHIYVNGEYVTTKTNTQYTSKISAEGYDRSKLAVSYFKFNTPKSASQVNQETAIDNLKVTYFTQGATVEDAAAYHYKDWQPLYKYTVATIDSADAETVYYDDFAKALQDAGDTDVIRLKSDVTDVLINENAIVDANIYDGDGNISGTYSFDFKSSQGYVAEVNDGIYTISKSTQTVNVKWDPVCDGGCDCNAVFGGHILAAETVAVFGQTLEFPFESPVFETVDGLEREFLGWSYENDGTVDTLLPVTAEDVANGELTIYPVYRATQYSIEYINASGKTVSYHFADEYASLMASAASGSTLKFHTDVTANTTVTLSKVITIDLNGFAFKHENVRTLTYNAKQNSKGAWVKDGDPISTEGTAEVAAFLVKGSDRTLNYVTSRPGARVYKAAVTRTILLNEGEVVSDTVATKSDTFISYQSAARSVFNITGDITFYVGYFICNDWNTNINSYTINIDGATFYQVSYTDSLIRCNEGGVYNFKNSKFYTNSLFSNYTDLDGGRKTEIVIDNCVVLGKIQLSRPGDTLVVNNSILYSEYSDAKATIGYGTKEGAHDSTVAEGYVLVKENETQNLPLLTSAVVTYDPETFLPVYDYPTTDTPYTTKTVVKKCSEVADSITDARLSMLYYTNFDMMLYIPVVDGTDITSVSGFTGGTDIVKIDGNPYYAYRKACSTLGAADAVKTAVSYTANGVSYKQCFSLSALVYAELILNDTIEDVEAKAVANMVRFIKEARKQAGLEIPAKIAELEALYTLDGYAAKETYDTISVDTSGLTGVSVSFAINGTNVGYVIKLDQTTFANAENATVTIKYTDGTVVEGVGEFVAATEDTAAYYKYVTTGTKVYDIIGKAVEITVTLPESEDLVGTYSVGSYIGATDNDLAKAMYEFGLSAKAYREYLESL